MIQKNHDRRFANNLQELLMNQQVKESHQLWSGCTFKVFSANFCWYFGIQPPKAPKYGFYSIFHVKFKKYIKFVKKKKILKNLKFLANTHISIEKSIVEHH